jgi:hypothetical protein
MFPAPKIWLKYLDFVMNHGGSTDVPKMRSLFERAAGACGEHLASAAELWAVLLDYEENVFQNVQVSPFSARTHRHLLGRSSLRFNSKRFS